MKYKFGLRNCFDGTQEYKLSHVLASYQRGFNDVRDKIQIGVPDTSIADGSLDFWVPSRYVGDYTIKYAVKRFFRRIPLAWKVLTNKASILYYE
jgi:hypothetical protein